MQNNDSRLIKAAKRTFRAEITLVIVIIVIASWSVYALYKLALGGSDNLLGLSLTKLSTENNNGRPHQPMDQQRILTNNHSAAQPKGATSQQISPHPIYLASNAAVVPIPQRSDQLNSIQSLIAGQNLNLNNPRIISTLSNGGILNPNTIQPSSLSTYNRFIQPATSSYNPNLVENSFSRNLGQFPSQLMNAQLITSAFRDNHPYSHESNVPPNRITSLDESPPRYRELDYESNSPDYGNPTPADHDQSANDRQAEESNRDPGESVVDNASTEEEQDNTSHQPEAASEVPNESNEVNDESHPETTTLGPTSEINNQDDNQTDKENQSGANNDENEDGQSTSAQDTESPAEDKEISPEEEENSKAAGLTIDEEVDRMTQPSLGSVSQHDIPFNYGDTVQFDDLPNPVVTNSKRHHAKPIENGRLVARFADPQKAIPANHSKRAKDQDLDLQVDHDTVSVGPTIQSPKDSPSSELIKLINKMRKIKERRKKREKNGLFEPEVGHKLKSAPNSKRRPTVSRKKRQLARYHLITAPYEIDGYLNNLNIDNLIEQTFVEPATKRQPRSYSNPPKEVGSLEAAPSELVSKTAGPSGKRKRKRNHTRRKKMKNKLKRRSDEEEEEDDDEEEVDTGSEEAENEPNEHGTDSSPTRAHQFRGQQLDPRYHYITSNDTTLQDLLTRQHLLDALRTSQLPSPSLGGSNQQQFNQTVVAPSNATISSPGSGEQQVAPQNNDHQQAGSLYSVDHGLLLYPASNDDYSSKSMSKKKKKHEKKKEKKKMTVAVKKGGHKKKKHKKEEKKFIKEKKFKGAKKGKKVSKGKGGQGGKKGKKLYKDKGFKKKGFKNVYHKEEFGQKKSYFDEFRDKDFKKKWKKFDDKYNYAQMKKWQAKDVKGAKKMKDHGEKFKKYDKGKWKKKYHKHSKENSESSKKHKKSDGF